MSAPLEIAAPIRRKIEAELARRATLGAALPPPPAGDGKVGES